MQEMLRDLEAAQHSKQVAEKELQSVKEKAKEVAGKLERTGNTKSCYCSQGAFNICTTHLYHA